MSDSEVKKLPFVVEPEYILDLNGAVQDLFGETIQEVAARDPHEAYRIIRLAMLAMMNDADKATLDGTVVATAHDDGEETPKNVARHALEGRMPEVVTEPMQIELSMWDAPEGFERKYRTADRAIHLVVSFTVEPLNLA